MEKIFKYYPEDFGELPVKVIHMDLDFDVYEKETTVDTKLRAKALKEIKTLSLNAKNLEILEIKCSEHPCTHEYDKKKDKLIVTFSEPVKEGAEIVLEMKNIVRPTKNVLEGLYFDETPKGCPPTQITQCQQWGFQRIVPCFDDMTAKCTYRTSITGDKKYTNMITNGDVVKERHPVGEGREKILYSNEVTPMATYLFFLGLGTYDTFKREFEYPDGHKFMLELLAQKGTEPTLAKKALDILFNGIMWIHLFTGPDKYKNEKIAVKILELVDEREKLKKEDKDYSEIAKKLSEMISGLQLGYKYTGTVYREIAMQNSDVGGMENVGNTTIASNRILPYRHMTDRAFEYMCRVKTHEFYHNLNGSEVTGWSPFEIWLNEAVTVHIERGYHKFLFGEDYGRLSDVMDLLNPLGVLLLDEGAQSMPIEPEGFNNPMELITHITYVKAPEFVRMIKTFMGKENFVKGLHEYHSKYKHSNATRKQWLECMENASGMKFQDMAETWLKKLHYPKVSAKVTKEDNGLTINLEQLNGEWELPFVVAVFDKEGKQIEEKKVRVNSKNFSINFSDIEDYGFISMNRGYSFYGKLYYDEPEDELFLKVRKDTDIINKYMAFYFLFDREKTRLIEDDSADVDERLIELYFEFLSDDKLMSSVGPQILALFEYVEDKKYAHHYKKLYDVKKKIILAIANKHEKELKNIYNKYDSSVDTGNYLQDMAVNIKRRQVKNVCLAILAELDNPEIHSMIKKQFENSSNITEEIAAFGMYLNSSAPDKLQILKEYEEVAKKNIVHWEIFLLTVARNDSNDAIDIIKELEKSESFRIEQTNDQRMYMSFAYNKKKSLQTPEGRKFLEESLLKLAVINEYSALHLLEVFSHVDDMEEEYYVPVMSILVKILNEIDKDEYPSVYNTTKRIISKLPKAKEAYDRETIKN